MVIPSVYRYTRTQPCCVSLVSVQKTRNRDSAKKCNNTINLFTSLGFSFPYVTIGRIVLCSCSSYDDCDAVVKLIARNFSSGQYKT